MALGRWKQLFQKMVQRRKDSVVHSSSVKDPKQLEVTGKMDQILGLLTSIISRGQLRQV